MNELRDEVVLFEIRTGELTGKRAVIGGEKLEAVGSYACPTFTVGGFDIERRERERSSVKTFDRLVLGTEQGGDMHPQQQARPNSTPHWLNHNSIRFHTPFEGHSMITQTTMQLI